MTTPIQVKKYFAPMNTKGPYWRKWDMTGFSSVEPWSIRYRVNSASRMLSSRMATMAAKIFELYRSK
jgi:hypothetical protein